MINIADKIYNQIDYSKALASKSPDEAIELSKDAYGIAKSNNLIIEQAYALLSIAYAYRVKSDASNMLDYSHRALSIFKDKNYIIGQAKSLNLIGVSYFYISMYDDAIIYFSKANDLLLYTEDNLLKSSVLNNIGEVYRESEMFDKAMYYYEVAIEIARKDNHIMNQAVILSGIGEVHFIKKEYEKSLDTYKRGYQLLENENNIIYLAEIENKIGRIYFVLEDFQKAKEYYFSSLKKLRELDNKFYIIDVLINIAELYSKVSFGGVLNLYEKAVEVGEYINSKKKLSKVYKLISTYHEDEGDYKNALSYHKKYTYLNEEIMSARLKSKLEILNIELKHSNNLEDSGTIKLRLENEIKRQQRELIRIKNSNELLEKKAYEDELTGISNRRSINIYLSDMLKKKYDKDNFIILFMIDIDKFKKYNDYWGHSKGDECLKSISGAIQKIQKDRNDIFGRYGGEEFIYISNTEKISYEEVLELANKIRIEVEELGLYYISKNKKRNITISIGGVAGINSKFDSILDIIERADKELYKAKDNGRNRVELNYIN